jgi:hypothetical protein
VADEPPRPGGGGGPEGLGGKRPQYRDQQPQNPGYDRKPQGAWGAGEKRLCWRCQHLELQGLDLVGSNIGTGTFCQAILDILARHTQNTLGMRLGRVGSRTLACKEQQAAPFLKANAKMLSGVVYLEFFCHQPGILQVHQA